jgi:hypothetical protein
MKSHAVHRRSRAALACLLAAAAFSAPAPRTRAADKLKPEEVVARHLDSLGKAAARETMKGRMAVGTVTLVLHAPSTGQMGGRAVMASEGSKHMIGMAFEDSRYPQERVGYDGADVTTSFVRPGVRSTLGDFLMSYKVIMKSGLLGGVLSGAWPLLNLSEKKAKLEYGGESKVGDRRAYQLKYQPEGGSDLRISLFFDAQSFQHLRTEYTRVISSPMTAGPDAPPSQNETRYKMVEEFSDYREEGGLTLPHGYVIRLEFLTQRGSFKADWEFSLNQFLFNQPLAPDSFKVAGG